MRRNHSKISESLQIGILLAIVGGFLEAYTFISRDRVFANCQTGNLVLLVMSIANGQLYQMLTYVLPITAFIVGVLITQKIRDLFSFYPRIHWRQIMILFEVVCLLIAVFVPLGKLDIVVTTLISFVCSLQTDSFRKMHGNFYATTMCTGNLRAASENLYAYISEKDRQAGKNSFKYFLIVFAFVTGALIGVFLTNAFMEKAALFCCLLLLVTFFLMFFHTPEEKLAIEKLVRTRKIKKIEKKAKMRERKHSDK